MSIFKYSIILIISLFCIPAYAEFYKYTDENGKVRYTDDLSKVPEKQREKLQSYGAKEKPPAQTPEESGQIKENSSEAGSSDSGDTAPISEPSDNGKAPDITELAETKKNLEKRKKDLETEYQALMKEQGDILRLKGRTLSQAAASDHNEKLARLNDKIVEYQKKLRALDNDISAYNKKVDEQKKKDSRPAQENKE